MYMLYQESVPTVISREITTNDAIPSVRISDAAHARSVQCTPKEPFNNRGCTYGNINIY